MSLKILVTLDAIMLTQQPLKGESYQVSFVVVAILLYLVKYKSDVVVFMH